MADEWHETWERNPTFLAKSTKERTMVYRTESKKFRNYDYLTALNQVVSPFLGLPGEIRNLIYEHVMGGHTITPLYRYNSKDPGTKGHFAHKIISPRPCLQHGNDKFPDLQPASTLLSLTQVSRALHSETRFLIFRINTFRISSISGSQDLRRRLSTEQLAAIRVVQFYRCMAFILRHYGDHEHFALRAERYSQALKGLEGLEEVRLIACKPCHVLCPGEREWEEARAWVHGCVGTKVRVEVEDEGR